MFDIYSEVRAIISPNVIGAIEGCVVDTVRQYVLTASIEEITTENETQYHLYGTLDGILIAKSKLEELLNCLHIKQLAKESSERESTTLSEENSSFADEGNTSYDKEGTDKTSCLSDDKELETNLSSNGNVSTNTESSIRPMRLRSMSKKLRFILKERPRVSQRLRSMRLPPQLRTLKKKSILRNKSQRSADLKINDPETLSENLEHMKLATEESDFDSPELKTKDHSFVGNNSKLDSKLPYNHFCDLCSFKTKRSSHFLKHKAIHEKILSCPQCSYQTTKQHYYDRHQRLHCLKRNFVHQCEQCCYKTHRKEHLNRHMSSAHGDKRPYLCHICGKAFKRGDALQQHNLIHSEVLSENTNYKCSVCEKQFRSQSHLLEHRAVHSEFRSFLCEMCGAVFKTRSVHRKHMQTIHRNPRSHTCEVCNKKFNTTYTLKRHKKIHSIKPVILKPILGTVNGAPGIAKSHIHSDPSSFPVSEMSHIPSTSAIQPMNPLAQNPIRDPLVTPVSLPETAVSSVQNLISTSVTLTPETAAVFLLDQNVPQN
ncbi:zinc finger and SCAN domain-containing protein 31 isoform X3 [Parasteatoda tepidariorum]|uniref:zinc finger and SCAN domain-containing protein 31 isoform X3 n=1 Tax=Parasteatoda tepidariorum TaxID=114398 RepID=UPI00077FB73B|nr:zinc finger and SCAN domain-containing protein 26 isoform X3 [Parasteatoda tepidariorum]